MKRTSTRDAIDSAEKKFVDLSGNQFPINLSV